MESTLREQLIVKAVADCHHIGGCTVNGTAVDALLIDQSHSYGSCHRRIASEAAKLFRLPPTYLGLSTIRLLL